MINPTSPSLPVVSERSSTLYQVKFTVLERKIKEIKDTLYSFEQDNYQNLAKIATEMNVVHAKALETLGIVEDTFFYFVQEEITFSAILIDESTMKLKEVLVLFTDRIYPRTKDAIINSGRQHSVLSGVVKVSLLRTMETIKSIIIHLATREWEIAKQLPHPYLDTNEVFTLASSERNTTRELDHLRDVVKRIPHFGDNPLLIPDDYIEYCKGKQRIRQKQSASQIKEAILKTKPRESTSFMPAQNGSAYWFPPPRIKDKAWYGLTHNYHEPLLNFRFQVDEGLPERAHLMVNCGSINTEARAGEYVWGIKYACETSKRKRLDGERFFWHQINSNSTEEELIVAQNKISRVVSQQLEKYFNKPAVAHINLSLNFATLLPWEESHSKLMNLEGWAQVTLWALEDVKFAAALILDEDTQFLFNNLLAQSEALERSRILIAKAKTENWANLSTLQDSLKRRLTTCAVLAYAIGTSINFKKDNITDLEKLQISKAKTLLMVLSYSLAMQTNTQSDLNLKTLSRVTEVELHLLLDMLLDCISTINCKSGLDRTGYIRACWDGLRTMWKDFKDDHIRANKGSEIVCEALAYEDLLLLILSQDENTKALDTIHHHLMLDHPCCEDLDDLEQIEPVKNFTALLMAKINARSDSGAFLNAYKYQRLMLKHLLQVSMPLTYESSGTPGLKFGHGAGGLAKFFPNPHPLSRMPNFVMTEDKRLIKIVDGGGILNDLGRQFTTAARQMIHIMSEFRDH